MWARPTLSFRRSCRRTSSLSRVGARVGLKFRREGVVVNANKQKLADLCLNLQIACIKMAAYVASGCKLQEDYFRDKIRLLQAQFDKLLGEM